MFAWISISYSNKLDIQEYWFRFLHFNRTITNHNINKSILYVKTIAKLSCMFKINE